jgi:capsular polysaccharide transport system permease protein
MKQRSSLQITLAVWKALFLREAVFRVSHRRAGFVWLLAEPALHTAALMFIHSIVRPHRTEGLERPVWLMIGVLAFITWRNAASRTTTALSANEALFSYRQVKPVDTVLVRGVLEGYLSLLVAVIVFCVSGLFGLRFIPADPLMVLGAFLGMWLAGLGYGLICSVLFELVPEMSEVMILIMIPMYLFSGVIVPVTSFAEPYRSWVTFNPLLHGLEAARWGFEPTYVPVPNTSMAYLYGFGLTTLFFGLVLHNRFARRLMTQ